VRRRTADVHVRVHVRVRVRVRESVLPGIADLHQPNFRRFFIFPQPVALLSASGRVLGLGSRIPHRIRRRAGSSFNGESRPTFLDFVGG
jgi:hypothetical protein